MHRGEMLMLSSLSGRKIDEGLGMTQFRMFREGVRHGSKKVFANHQPDVSGIHLSFDCGGEPTRPDQPKHPSCRAERYRHVIQ